MFIKAENIRSCQLFLFIALFLFILIKYLKEFLIHFNKMIKRIFIDFNLN